MKPDRQPTMLRWAHLPECHSPPSGWNVRSFTSIAQVIAGQSPDSEACNEKGVGMPFLQGNAEFGAKHPNPTSWCTVPARTAAAGDTLISVRAPVGEVNRANQDYAIGRGLAAVRHKDSDQDFIHQGLQRWRWCLQRVAQGTTFDAVTARHFDQLTVSVPDSQEEQAAIARILAAVDTEIERARSAVDAARNIKRALMTELFERGTRGATLKKSVIGWIPSDWEVRTVSSVTSNFQYGLSVPMQRKGSLPILRMGNIQRGDVVFNELKYLDLPAHVTEPYLVQRGDVLFNRTNSQELVGKVGIYRRNDVCCFASYLIRVAPDTALVDSYYLGHVLNSYNAQCRIKRYATPGAQQVNINASNLGKVLIPVPVGAKGIDEQREIARILETAHVLDSSHEPKLSALEQLKKSLMHDLLTGKVRVKI